MRHGQRDCDKWFPFFIDKWLFGSTRHELAPDEQSVWVDLLVLSKKDNGFIRANEITPYPLTQLAGMFCKPEELVRRTIKKLLDPKVAKLVETAPGIYYLPSSDEYELSERQKRRVKAGMADTMAEKAVTERTNAVAKIRLEKSRVDKRREEGTPHTLTPDQVHKVIQAAGAILQPSDVKYKVLPAINMLQAEFKLPDPVETFKKKVAWWLDNPSRLRGNITLQLRNWWRIEADYVTREAAPLKVGKNTKPPTEFETGYQVERKAQMAKLVEVYGPLIEKARAEHNAKEVEALQTRMKEEMAEFSRRYWAEHRK